MDRIFRISGAAVLAAGALALALASTPALAGSLTCTPTTVSVAPSAGNLLVTCTEVPPSGTPPPTCSVSVLPSSLPASGGSVTVTASSGCGTISGWSGIQSTSLQGTLLSSFTDTILSNSGAAYTNIYAVTGSGGSNSAGVSVAAASSSGGGTGGATSCGTAVSIPFGPTTYTIVNVPGSAVAQFTVPSTTPIGTKGVVQISPEAGGSLGVTYAMTSAPCMFPTATDPVLGGVPAFSTSGGSITFKFQVGGVPPGDGTYVLQPGLTYYVDFKAAKGKTIQIYVRTN